MVSDTSVPSPGTLRTVAEPAAAGHPGVDRLGQPFPVAGHRGRVEPSPAVPDEQRHLAPAPPRRRSRPPAAPDHFAALTVASRAAASSAPRSSSSSQSPTVTASTAIPCCASTSCWMSRTPAARVVPWPSSEPGGLAVEQPGAQLPLLGPGQLDDLLGLVRAALDQGQRLQDRVVHPGRHVGAFLGPDPGLPLDHEVAGDAQPPGAQQHHDRGDHEQVTPASWPQQARWSGWPDSSTAQAADQQHGGDRHAQPREPRPPAALGQAEQRLGQAPDHRLLVRAGSSARSA